MTRKERRAEADKRRMEIVKCIDRIFWEKMGTLGPDAKGNMPIPAALKTVSKYVGIMITKEPRNQTLIESAAMKWQGILIAVLKAHHGVKQDAFRMAVKEETKGRIEG